MHHPCALPAAIRLSCRMFTQRRARPADEWQGVCPAGCFAGSGRPPDCYLWPQPPKCASRAPGALHTCSCTRRSNGRMACQGVEAGQPRRAESTMLAWLAYIIAFCLPLAVAWSLRWPSRTSTQSASDAGQGFTGHGKHGAGRSQPLGETDSSHWVRRTAARFTTRPAPDSRVLLVPSWVQG